MSFRFMLKKIPPRFVIPYAKSAAPVSMATMEYTISTMVTGRMYEPMVLMVIMAW